MVVQVLVEEVVLLLQVLELVVKVLQEVQVVQPLVEVEAVLED